MFFSRGSRFQVCDRMFPVSGNHSPTVSNLKFQACTPKKSSCADWLIPSVLQNNNKKQPSNMFFNARVCTNSHFNQRGWSFHTKGRQRHTKIITCIYFYLKLTPLNCPHAVIQVKLQTVWPIFKIKHPVQTPDCFHFSIQTTVPPHQCVKHRNQAGPALRNAPDGIGNCEGWEKQMHKSGRDTALFHESERVPEWITSSCHGLYLQSATVTGSFNCLTYSEFSLEVKMQTLVLRVIFWLIPEGDLC